MRYNYRDYVLHICYLLQSHLAAKLGTALQPVIMRKIPIETPGLNQAHHFIASYLDTASSTRVDQMSTGYPENIQSG